MTKNFEGDLELNYAPDIVMLTCSGTFRRPRGTAPILSGSGEIPDAKIECFNKLVDGEFAFVEWRANNPSVEVKEGADSFVIRDGKIVFQSIHYKVHRLERQES